MSAFDNAWNLLKQAPISPKERALLNEIRRKDILTRVSPTQLSADPHAQVQPRNIQDIPGALNEMTPTQANEFNAAMANRPEAKLELQRHMAEVQARKDAEAAADAAYQEPQTEGFNPNRIQMGEPMDIIINLLKAKKKSKPFHGYNPNKHHRKGGLNAKGRAKAKREQGSNLKPPVTTKPSKLKPGSKKAKRRKSFCARMTGVKGPTSKKGKLTPKGAALKRWNC